MSPLKQAWSTEVDSGQLADSWVSLWVDFC